MLRRAAAQLMSAPEYGERRAALTEKFVAELKDAIQVTPADKVRLYETGEVSAVLWSEQPLEQTTVDEIRDIIAQAFDDDEVNIETDVDTSLIGGLRLQVGDTVYDGSLAMGNMMLAAHSLGLGSIWIHRAKQEFEEPEFRQLLCDLGIEGEWEGIGHCAVGYTEGEVPKAAERKPNRVFWVE